MKKLLLATFALGLMLAAALPVQAASKWAGFKGGLNMADISSDDDADTDFRNGFSGGGFFGMGIGESFGVQLEGLYVMKGAKGEVAGDDATAKIDYLEFPVLFVAKFPAGETLGFNVFGGPTFGFNINSELEVDGSDTLDLSDDTKSFELGAAIGAGLEFLLESFSIVVDARYTLGATEIYDEDSADDKNRGIGIMGGVSFPIGAAY
jgi:hypothetical protein